MITYLISRIVSNPIILILLIAAAFSTGGSMAWYIQSLRIEKANLKTERVAQEFKQYQQDQRELFLKSEETSRANAIESEKQFNEQKLELEKAIEAGDVLKRCIASGNCNGMRKPSCVPSARSNGIQTEPRTVENSESTVPVTREPAVEEFQVVNDCAEDVLRYNRLIEAVINQPGF